MEAKWKTFLLRRRHGADRVTTVNMMVCLLVAEEKQNQCGHLFKCPTPGEDRAGGAMWGVFGPHKDKANQSTASTVFTPPFHLFVWFSFFFFALLCRIQPKFDQLFESGLILSGLDSDGSSPLFFQPAASWPVQTRT